jgi:hypothetical protein
MGQDAHIADSTKAVRIMLGVDDNNPDQLRLVPRYPVSWTHMQIKDYPVLIGNKRQKLTYQYIRKEDVHTFTYQLEQPVNTINVRLGPLKSTEVMVTVKDQEYSKNTIKSGDSLWVWINDITNAEGQIIVHDKKTSR